MRRLVLVGVLVGILVGVPCWQLTSTHAQAGTGQVVGTVTIRRDGGAADASGVVVYLVGFEEPPPRQEAEIRQRNKQFIPDLLPITVGQSVSFPNDDPLFHNVFSPSSSRRFDLGQYPKGTTKTKQFPSVGVVDVFCNIHPEMAATVLILPNRRYARARADGTFRIDGVPPGTWKLYAYSRRAVAPVSVNVEVSAGLAAEVTLSLEESRTDFTHKNKYGEKYRDPSKY